MGECDLCLLWNVILWGDKVTFNHAHSCVSWLTSYLEEWHSILVKIWIHQRWEHDGRQLQTCAATLWKKGAGKICQTEPSCNLIEVPRPRYIPTNPRWQPVGWVLLWWSSTWVRRSLGWPSMTSGTGPWWVLIVIMLLVIILATLLCHWSSSYEYVPPKQSFLCDIVRIAFQWDANLHAIII